jgi:hypothetical protein
MDDTADHNYDESSNVNENAEYTENSQPESLLYGKDTSKYEKMRAMLPEGAVRQKMMVDGWSQGEIEEFFGNSIATAGGEPASSAPNPPRPALPFSLSEQIKLASSESGNEPDESSNVSATVVKPTIAPIASLIPKPQVSVVEDEEAEEESDFFAEQDDPYSLFGNKRPVSSVKVSNQSLLLYFSRIFHSNLLCLLEYVQFWQG